MASFAPPCPHCGSRLLKWRVPEEATWVESHFFVCFNDDCSYYREGWQWMEEQYKQHASYRYAFNPNTRSSLLIPVWSDEATREMIVDEEEEVSR